MWGFGDGREDLASDSGGDSWDDPEGAWSAPPIQGVIRADHPKGARSAPPIQGVIRGPVPAPSPKLGERSKGDGRALPPFLVRFS